MKKSVRIGISGLLFASAGIPLALSTAYEATPIYIIVVLCVFLPLGFWAESKENKGYWFWRGANKELEKRFNESHESTPEASK